MPMKKESGQPVEEGVSPVVSIRSQELAARILRLATLDRRKKGNMAKVLMEDIVAAEEASRGLPPITEDPHWEGLINT